LRRARLHLNREIIDRIAGIDADLPLYVVGEFEPHRGEWIPYHVLRGLRENHAAVRAAIGKKRIQTAAMILAPGTQLRKMRLIALGLAPRALIIYGEDLQVVKDTGWGKYLLRRAMEAAGSHRSRQWLQRLRHPEKRKSRFEPGQPSCMVSSQAGFGLPGVKRRWKGHEPLADGVTVVIPSRDGRELLETLLPSLLPQLSAQSAVPSCATTKHSEQAAGPLCATTTHSAQAAGPLCATTTSDAAKSS